jgi:hypothetical protein
MAAIDLRVRWKGEASHIQHGRCDGCGRLRDDNDRPLVVARRPRSKLFLCLACFIGRLPARERRASA